jgi:hypothetical protein
VLRASYIEEEEKMALDPKEYSAVQKVRKGICYPDLVNSLALKPLPKETAEAEGWPTFADFVPCANGHVAPKFCKNSLCVSCWRVRQGRDPLHPRAKDKQYYKQRDPAAVTANGTPVVIAAPTPPEPTKGEQTLLAKLAELKDIDKACAAVPGWTRGIVESRSSSNPVFRDALRDMTDRLGIATRAPDAENSKFTPELEKNFAMRLVDCGLLEQTRTELGVSASAYHSHLERSPTFAALIAASEPLARLTLRDRATKEAASGNDRLLKILEVDEPTSFANMDHTQINAELQRMLNDLVKRNAIPTTLSYKRLSTGEIIPAADIEKFETTHSTPEEFAELRVRAPPLVNSNFDLVSA